MNPKNNNYRLKLVLCNQNHDLSLLRKFEIQILTMTWTVIGRLPVPAWGLYCIPIYIHHVTTVTHHY